MNNIPEVINNYKAYKGTGAEMVGLSDEIKLPDFEEMTTDISGAGLLGTLSIPVVGQFNSMEMEIPFRTLTTDMFETMADNSAVSLTLRGAEQYTEGSSGATKFHQVRIVVGGKFKSFSGGSMKIGNPTGSSLKIELWHILIEVDGVIELEIDKFNSVYTVHGIDKLSEVKKYC